MNTIYQVYNSGLAHEGVGIEKTRKDHIFMYNRRVEDWDSLIYELKDGGYTDYQNENKGMHLCSLKLREILEQQASEYDVFQWLEATVRHEGEERPYYVLHFPEPADVINKEKSKYSKSDGKLIVPRLSRALCEKYNVFTLLNPNSPLASHRIYIRENVKKAVEAAGCTGMEFQKENLAE